MWFSLRMLLGLTAVVALAAGALYEGSELWIGIYLFVIGIAYSMSFVVAIFGRGRSRRFAAGFAVVGLVHLLLAFNQSSFAGMAPGPYLLVNEAAVRVASIMPPPQSPTPLGITWDAASTLMRQQRDESVDHRIVGICCCVLYSLTAFLMGWLGGWMAVFAGRGSTDPVAGTTLP